MAENKHEVVIYKEEEAPENQLNVQAEQISKDIANCKDSNELNSLYDAFKLNDIKKNVFRINKFNDLLDKITEEAAERFNHRSDEMSNKEVIDYMNAIQSQLESAKEAVDRNKEVNLTQINNTLNVNLSNQEPSLSRESREKVIDFVNNLLHSGDPSSTDNVIDAKIKGDSSTNGE